MESTASNDSKRDTLIPASYQDFRSWLVRYVDDVWGLPREFGENDDINFEELGMDSLEAHMMASLIEDEYRVTFEPMLLLEHRYLNDLAKYCTEVKK
jgi:acyl carrier protein